MSGRGGGGDDESQGDGNEVSFHEGAAVHTRVRRARIIGQNVQSSSEKA